MTVCLLIEAGYSTQLKGFHAGYRRYRRDLLEDVAKFIVSENSIVVPYIVTADRGIIPLLAKYESIRKPEIHQSALIHAKLLYLKQYGEISIETSNGIQRLSYDTIGFIPLVKSRIDRDKLECTSKEREEEKREWVFLSEKGYKLYEWISSFGKKS